MKIIFLLLFISFSVCGESKKTTPIIGKIIKLHGEVFFTRNQINISAKHVNHIWEKDQITTQTKSFTKLQLNDDTTISLGPNSHFKFKKWSIKNNKRTIIYNLLVGKLRSNIKKHAKNGETITYQINKISIGVRGTEFLTSAYSVLGKPTTDFLLTTGKVHVDATKLGGAVKNFDLTEGQSFNSQDLALNGLKAIKNISPELLQKIKNNQNYEMPNMQKIDGSFLSTAALLGAVLIPPVANIFSSDSYKEDKKKTDKNLDLSTNKKLNTTKTITDRDYHYVLKDNPIDIRNAIITHQKNLKENNCYYWIYKKLSGGFRQVRFKRERDCDDYENNL